MTVAEKDYFHAYRERYERITGELAVALDETIDEVQALDWNDILVLALDAGIDIKYR